VQGYNRHAMANATTDTKMLTPDAELFLGAIVGVFVVGALEPVLGGLVGAWVALTQVHCHRQG